MDRIVQIKVLPGEYRLQLVTYSCTLVVIRQFLFLSLAASEPSSQLNTHNSACVEIAHLKCF